MNMFKWFPYIFGAFVIVFVLIFVANIGMGVACWMSGDPNNIACFMISERHEVGVRYRN